MRVTAFPSGSNQPQSIAMRSTRDASRMRCMSVINGNGAQPKQNKYIQIHNLIVNNISI